MSAFCRRRPPWGKKEISLWRLWCDVPIHRLAVDNAVFGGLAAARQRGVPIPMGEWRELGLARDFTFQNGSLAMELTELVRPRRAKGGSLTVPYLLG